MTADEQGPGPTPRVGFHEFNDDIKWMDHPHPPRKGGWCQVDISYDNRVICCGEQRDHPVHQLRMKRDSPMTETKPYRGNAEDDPEGYCICSAHPYCADCDDTCPCYPRP